MKHPVSPGNPVHTAPPSPFVSIPNMTRQTLATLVSVPLAFACSDGFQGFAPTIGQGPVLQNLQAVGRAGFQVVGPYVVMIADERQFIDDQDGDGLLETLFLLVFNTETNVLVDTGIRPVTDSFEILDGLVIFESAFSVVEAYELETGRRISVGSAVSSRKKAGLLMMEVSEATHGDLNGDGDAEDQVAHFFDPIDRSITNTGLGSAFFPLDQSRSNDRFVTLRVLEESNGTDLDGDGEISGFVTYVYDARTRQATSLGFDTSNWHLEGSRILYRVSESHNSVDLNDDGDQEDSFLHVIETASGEVFQLPGYCALDFDGDRILCGVPENELDHVDENSDFGNLRLGVLDVRSGTLRTFGLLLGESGSLQGSHYFFSVDERQQQEDLNHDGDMTDGHILHVLDLAQGTVRLVGESGYPRAIKVLGSLALLFIPESLGEFGSEETRDLNGDLDSDDSFVFVYDLTTGELTNSQVQIDILSFGFDILDKNPPGDLVTFAAAEAGADLNGDGDAWDNIAFTFDVARREFLNHELAIPDYLGTGNQESTGLFLVDENCQAEDLNGDGVISVDTLVLHRFGPSGP